MKPQDIIFIIILIIFIFLRRPRLLIGTGLICLLLSIPLFAFWIFFTAERLVWYAASFLLAAIFMLLIRNI